MLTDTNNTATPTLLRFNPDDPYRHAVNASNAIWNLDLPLEAKTRLYDLVNSAEREAFIRGMDPTRPMA